MITIETLKIIREKRGYSQLKVAMHVNTSQDQISRYESGNREPNKDTLRDLVKYLDTNADYILGLTADDRPYYDRNQSNLSDQEYEAIKLFRNLDEDEKVVVLKLLKAYIKEKDLTKTS